MKKKILSILLAGVLACSLAACGGGSEEVSPSAGKTVDGNVLDDVQSYTSYLQADPSTLDSIKGNDSYSNYILQNIMEPLTRTDTVDGKDTRVPGGAASWESSEDGLVWTFHLNDNKWSDGKPVTAEDYAYALRRSLDPTSGSLNGYLVTCIKNGAAVNSGEMAPEELGVKAVDDKTLEITLENPTPHFLSLTDTRPFFPQRQDIVEQYGDSYGAEADTIIGCGPFNLDSWTHNSELVLSKNDNYWDKDNVYLDTFTYKVIAEESSIMNSFDNGSLDTVNCGTKEWMERFEAKDGVNHTTYDGNTIRFHFYNTKDPLFQNEKVRQAFTIAINREDVVSTIFYDVHSPYTSWVPSTVSMGSLGNYRELAGSMMGDILALDPKELLIEGMEELGLGSDPSTLTVTFTLGGTNQWLKNYGEYYQQKFKEVLGVNVVLDQNEWGTFQSKTNSGDYQMAYMSWAIDYNDPFSMLQIMESSAGSVPTFWVNEEYDSLIAQASTEMDEEKRLELLSQAEKILIDEAPVAPIINETVHTYSYDYVKNQAVSPYSTMGSKKIYISGK